MQLRDQFAMAAMQGMYAAGMQDRGYIVDQAYKTADEMMQERQGWDFSKDPDAVVEYADWQPDWSQAPNEANTITIDAYGVGQYWVMYQGAEPKQGASSWHDEYRGRYLGGFEPKGFNGDWRNSLRKRPEVQEEK